MFMWGPGIEFVDKNGSESCTVKLINSLLLLLETILLKLLGIVFLNRLWQTEFLALPVQDSVYQKSTQLDMNVDF